MATSAREGDGGEAVVPEASSVSLEQVLTSSSASMAGTVSGNSPTYGLEVLRALIERLPRFDERVTDLGLIARGGMGEIHRAWDEILRRELALKLLQSSENEDAARRFIVEARVTAWLDHPSIVPVYDIGTYKGAPCFLMKLVEGITLHAEIAGGPPWGVSRARDQWLLEAFFKVCDAVSLAHSRGIIHRDIKPENIMLGSFSQVYLMDWGVAFVRPDGAPRADPSRPTQQEPQDGSRESISPAQSPFAGTLSYMAPEQALGVLDKIDERTDVFLLGGVLYEMLTGRTPHPRSKNLYASVYTAVACDVTPVADLRPDLPRALGDAAMRALSRDAEARFATPLELKTALRAATGLSS